MSADGFFGTDGDFALRVAAAFGVPPWLISAVDPPPSGHVSRHLRTQQLRIERRASRKARRGVRIDRQIAVV